MTVNKVILVGNLGADPESKTSQSGVAVCNLRLATSSRVKAGDTWEDRTEWHRVVCFGRTAENVDRFCRKGKELYIEGRLQTRKWQDKDGADRWSTEVVADVVRFIGGRGDGDGSAAAPQRSGGGYGGSSSSSGGGYADSYADGGDPDIPF